MSNPYRLHYPHNDPRTDQPVMLRTAAKKRPSQRRVDFNGVRGYEYDYCLHWAGGPEENRYTHLWTGKYVWRKGKRVEERVRMPANLRHRDVRTFKHAHVKRWRSAPTGVKSKRVRTVSYMQTLARLLGVEICWEIKSQEYRIQKWADRFVAAVQKAGGKAHYMTLVDMPSWGHKLKAFHLAIDKYPKSKSLTALLPRGKRPAAFVRFYPKYIDRVWGNWA